MPMDCPTERKDLYLALAVAGVAFLVYANSLGNGFVWDDDSVIVANSALKGDALSLFRGIDVTRYSDLNPYYRPLTLLSFLAEERLHGLTPFLVRLFNVILHAANAFLVCRLARSFFTDRFAALLAGLLFAVHPLHTEGVNFNAGGRNTLLAAFFILASYLVHTRSAKISGAFAGAVLFLAGVLSKETALAILPFIVAHEVCSLRDSGARLGRQTFARLLLYAGSTALYLVLRDRALSGAGVHLEIMHGLGSRLLDNVYIIPRYLLTVVWPTTLSPNYFIPDDLNVLALPLVVAWLSIATIAGWLLTRGRSRATFFGLNWLTAFWLPVSGIVAIPSAPLADRYLYVPAIGLWLIVADQAARLLQSRAIPRLHAALVAVLVLLTLGVLTVRRNLDWKSDVTLFSRVVEQYPEQAFGYHNLGCAYLDKEKDLDLAERNLEKAVALDPLFPRLWTQIGYVRLLRGDYGGALRRYTEALRLNPFDAEAHLNSAIALENLGRSDEAAIEYRNFLATPHNELAGARRMAVERVRAFSSLANGERPEPVGNKKR
jgi:hypothetical protein